MVKLKSIKLNSVCLIDLSYFQMMPSPKQCRFCLQFNPWNFFRLT